MIFSLYAVFCATLRVSVQSRLVNATTHTQTDTHRNQSCDTPSNQMKSLVPRLAVKAYVKQYIDCRITDLSFQGHSTKRGLFQLEGTCRRHLDGRKNNDQKQFPDQRRVITNKLLHHERFITCQSYNLCVIPGH